MAIHFQCLPPKFLGASARRTSFSTLLLIGAGGKASVVSICSFLLCFWEIKGTLADKLEILAGKFQLIPYFEAPN